MKNTNGKIALIHENIWPNFPIVEETAKTTKLLFIVQENGKLHAHLNMKMKRNCFKYIEKIATLINHITTYCISLFLPFFCLQICINLKHERIKTS